MKKNKSIQGLVDSPKLENLKTLRASLVCSKLQIDADWSALGIEYDHYLAESLADLTQRLEEVTNLVNQEIGAMV